VAVVVLTAFGEWTTYLQAMDNGAVDYMNKPVRREDILLTVRKALARRGIRAPDVPSA
jgi:FixJ family two-component response regulator